MKRPTLHNMLETARTEANPAYWVERYQQSRRTHFKRFLAAVAVEGALGMGMCGAAVFLPRPERLVMLAGLGLIAGYVLPLLWHDLDRTFRSWFMVYHLRKRL